MLSGRKIVASTLDGKKDCPCPKIVRESGGVAMNVQGSYADWEKAVPMQGRIDRPAPSIGKQYGS